MKKNFSICLLAGYNWPLKNFTWYLLFVFSMFFSRGLAQQPIDQLFFKGTHNSYACCGEGFCILFWCWWGNSCPVMHNPLNEQMDDFGVWALELDFSIELENGIPELIVGHNESEGEGTWTHPDWGRTVREFLFDIRNAKSFQYRPTFIFFDHKGDDWGHPDFLNVQIWAPLLQELLIEVFGADNVFGPTAFYANNSEWPTVSELGGKVIPYIGVSFNNGTLFSSPLPPLFRRWIAEGGYTNADERTEKIASGDFTLISPDQYQEDWTFDHTAPPNPIYVQSGSPESFQVVNQYGHDCDSDPTNAGNPFQVSQQGTFRFPFDQVKKAGDKAWPGWTLLIKAGNYPESFTIDKRVTLKAEGGTVIIGE